MTILMTSRGCVYKCTYCGAGKSGNPINDGIKRRSPNNVLDEIRSLVKDHGIKEIIFVDDSLLVPSERIISILKGITKMREEEGVNLIWKSMVSRLKVLGKRCFSGFYHRVPLPVWLRP